MPLGGTLPPVCYERALKQTSSCDTLQLHGVYLAPDMTDLLWGLILTGIATLECVGHSDVHAISPSSKFHFEYRPVLAWLLWSSGLCRDGSAAPAAESTSQGERLLAHSSVTSKRAAKTLPRW